MLNYGVDNYLSFSVHGGTESGGVAGTVGNFLAFFESMLSLTPSQILAELLPGVAVLENVHPLFVHFPIASLSLFFIVDCVASFADKSEWRKLASWFLYLGALFAGLTVVAGLIAANSVAHGGDVHEIMEHHEHLGISVFTLAVALSVWRSLAKAVPTGPANILHLLLAGLLSVLLMFTADLGGLMVYGYGVSVAPVAVINQAADAAHHHGGDVDDHHNESDKTLQNDAVNKPVIPAPIGEQTHPSSEQILNTDKQPTDPLIHRHADGHEHKHNHAH